MRKFTPEEKELIVNTPITFESFDIDYTKLPQVDLDAMFMVIKHLQNYQKSIHVLRKSKRKDEAIDFFIRLLPNSYKVVEL